MTIHQWPADLPKPDRTGYGSQDQDARKQRQSEKGPPSWSLGFSSVATLVAMSVLLTRDEKAIFDNIHRYDLKRGTQLFWMPDPTTDGWGLLRSDGAPLLISGGLDDGKPILLAATWLCRFGDGTPAESVRGNFFQKTFNIVVMP